MVLALVRIRRVTNRILIKMLITEIANQIVLIAHLVSKFHLILTLKIKKMIFTG